MYAGIQILLPLRHWLYPGNVSWTEEGHRFAWHMKLRDKESRGEFLVRDAEGKLVGRHDADEFLESFQVRKVMTRPYLMLQLADRIAGQMEAEGVEGAQVFAEIECSLNGRRYQEFIDPEVDLVEAEWGWGHAGWVVPLREGLRGR